MLIRMKTDSFLPSYSYLTAAKASVAAAATGSPERRPYVMTRVAVALALLHGSTGLALSQSQEVKPAAGCAPAAKPATKTAPVPTNPAPTTAPRPQEVEKKKLKVGDAAPALTVDAWVKGDAVPSFQKGRVYIVEFWATWCLPCKASMPHLSEIQKNNPDITVICIAGSERIAKDAPDERLENLRKFVSARASEMGFRVAYDARSLMTANWMEAAGQRGIPCGFVVDAEGKVAYIGYPLDKGFERAFVAALKTAQDQKAAITSNTRSSTQVTQVAAPSTNITETAPVASADSRGVDTDPAASPIN